MRSPSAGRPGSSSPVSKASRRTRSARAHPMRCCRCSPSPSSRGPLHQREQSSSSSPVAVPSASMSNVSRSLSRIWDPPGNRRACPPMTKSPEVGDNRLKEIILDGSLAPSSSPDIEHERKVAIYDLVESNTFTLPDRNDGPYTLRLSIAEGRLLLDIANAGGAPCVVIGLALSPFRRIIKDYFMICESYYQAIRTSTPSQIETIDMARRSLHNEGSEILIERLNGKVEVDFDTARRLFTLVCVLHWRG